MYHVSKTRIDIYVGSCEMETRQPWEDLELETEQTTQMEQTNPTSLSQEESFG